MVSPKLRALAEDAIFQVVDNSVFRILLGLVGLPILLTFLFSVTPDGVSLLFGLKEWDIDAFGVGGPEPHLTLINGVINVVVFVLAGFFGVLFCISATSFFVPRMVEKGAADILFHKPVSRFNFYLARYFSGIVFVAFLSMLLVVGLYAGLSLVSGYDDPGLLWSAVTLTYTFALIYAFCMLVGVLTRSTVASILMTIVFWGVNGCTHTAWQRMEQTNDVLETSIAQVTEQFDAGEIDQKELELLTGSFDGYGSILTNVLRWLRGWHYVLPKTSDATILSARMRMAISPPVLDDSDAGLLIQSLGGDWEVVASESITTTPPALAKELGEIRLAVRTPDGATALLRRRDRRRITKGTRSHSERSRETSSLTREVLKSLPLTDLSEPDAYPEDKGEAISRRPKKGSTDEPESANDSAALAEQSTATIIFMLPVLATDNVRFTYTQDGHPVELGVFRRSDWIYSIETHLPKGASPQPISDLFEGIDLSVNRRDWYDRKFVSGAALAFNPTFSVLSSLGFAALMLLLGVWRLSRIDF